MDQDLREQSNEELQMETRNYTTQVEETLERYEKEIANEKQLVYEIPFELAKTLSNCYKIVSGFSSARDFTPVVKIVNCLNESIVFDEHDWNKFISNLTEHTTQEKSDFVGYEMYWSWDDSTNGWILDVYNRGTTFNFTETGVRALKNLSENVLNRFRMMREIDCYTFYFDFLRHLASKNVNGGTSVTIMLAHQLVCLHEILTKNEKKFLEDLSSVQLYL